MIKLKLRLYNLSFINTQVVLNKLDDAVVKIQGILQEIQNLKNETEDSKERETNKFEQAIKDQTLELKQEKKVSIKNQTNNLTSEFEELAARVNQTDEGRVKVHFKSEKS